MKTFKRITAIILVICLLCSSSFALAVSSHFAINPKITRNVILRNSDTEVPPISGEFGVEDNFEPDEDEDEDEDTKEEEYLPGDVSHDGRISNVDVVMICRYILLIIKEIDVKAADVHKDNKITNADVVTLVRYIVSGKA